MRTFVVRDDGNGLPVLQCFENGALLAAEEMGVERMLYLAEQLTATARRVVARTNSGMPDRRARAGDSSLRCDNLGDGVSGG